MGGAIRLSYSLETVDALVLSGLMKKVGVLIALFIPALLALSTLMNRLVRRPIAQALGFANAVADGDLDNPIEPQSGDEMGQLIEALRSLRIMHYAAWLARRWDDPAFKVAFPWFDSRRYWDEHILALREQVALMQEPPLEWLDF